MLRYFAKHVICLITTTEQALNSTKRNPYRTPHSDNGKHFAISDFFLPTVHQTKLYSGPKRSWQLPKKKQEIIVLKTLTVHYISFLSNI